MELRQRLRQGESAMHLGVHACADGSDCACRGPAIPGSPCVLVHPLHVQQSRGRVWFRSFYKQGGRAGAADDAPGARQASPGLRPH